MARKFYKTIFTVEVLSEDAPISSEISLADLEYGFTEGDWSGSVDVKYQELNSKEAAQELMEQGSDPGFFGLCENGDDDEEDESDGIDAEEDE